MVIISEACLEISDKLLHSFDKGARQRKTELSVKFIKWQSTFNLPTPHIQARIQHLSSTVSPAALLKTDLSSPQQVGFFLSQMDTMGCLFFFLGQLNNMCTNPPTSVLQNHENQQVAQLPILTVW